MPNIADTHQGDPGKRPIRWEGPIPDVRDSHKSVLLRDQLLGIRHEQGESTSPAISRPDSPRIPRESEIEVPDHCKETFLTNFSPFPMS